MNQAMSRDEIDDLRRRLLDESTMPLSTQIQLLKSDVTKLVSEIARLKGELSDSLMHQLSLFDEMQATADSAHADGARQMQQAALEICCPACTPLIQALPLDRQLQ